MSAAAEPAGGNAPFRGIASRFGLGKLALYAYHRPRSLFRRTMLEGGPLAQHRTRQGRAAMREAAADLPELAPPPGDYPVPVALLSGAAFWDQTAFAIASLQCHADRRIDPIVHDDGTLTLKMREAIARAVPWTRFVTRQEADARLDVRLPATCYWALRARRAAYPHLRKLTDLHAEDGFTLVLDSDILFFRRPDALLDWMAAPSGVLFIPDTARAYGYSDALMAALARGALPERMNVGLYGLPAACLDLDYLEHCCRVQLERERAQYLQEQALTALLVSGYPATVLPREDYRVLPDLAEGRQPTAALHHYVAHSKRSYFQDGWRRVLADLMASPLRRAAGGDAPPRPRRPLVRPATGGGAQDKETPVPVSVLMPVHNAAAYVGAALDSVLAQTHRPLQIIAVNDGSTDGTRSILARYEDRITVIDQENRGPSAASNRAFAASTGALVKFFDADDVMAPELIARQVARLGARRDAVALGEWTRFYGAMPADEPFPPLGMYRDAEPADWLAAELLGTQPMMQGGLWLIPRAIVEAAGGWDERLTRANDFEFFARVLTAAAEILHAPGARLYYRSGVAGSVSGRTSRAAIQSELLSLMLGTGHLLAAEDSPRTRRAAANILKQFDYTHYPAHPDLRSEAAARAAALGGADIAPIGPPNFHRLRRLLGWKLARRLEHAFGKRAPRPSAPNPELTAVNSNTRGGKRPAAAAGVEAAA